MNIPATTQHTEATPPWQLQMYQKSLKKRQKVELLMQLMGAPEGKRCLLISGHETTAP